MSELLRSVDARTRLAGTNQLEILLFTLGLDAATGRRESFGINVFKVREVMRAPQITRAPDMPDGVEGMVSQRGQLVPVIDLAHFVGIAHETPPRILVVTEYNGHVQGFLVEAVDRILRLDWSAMKVPPEMLISRHGGLVTAVTELRDGRLVMMLDVERILSETTRYDDEHLYQGIEPTDLSGCTVLFADDSSIARKQIERTLATMGVRGLGAVNGRKAWEELNRLAETAQATGRPLGDMLHAVITDIEMPEMDGFILTRRIKNDARFAGIPVIMHSSLSGSSNRQLGSSMGADDYVSKFEPRLLAQTLARRLKRRPLQASA
ncbi:chemotaxis protein [Pelomicrobium sp.]|uniref:chemotaxis protein n=1 Tax=Pelomicrobium sp. TaxID=2815319 RepID=UPI002FDE1F14